MRFSAHPFWLVAFRPFFTLALWILITAFALRVVAPQFLLAACGWFSGFAILAWCQIPLLLRARVDGREH
jgi:uncharacterized protein involved in response to NO